LHVAHLMVELGSLPEVVTGWKEGRTGRGWDTNPTNLPVSSCNFSTKKTGKVVVIPLPLSFTNSNFWLIHKCRNHHAQVI
jgi:hypothetical protein